MTGLNVWLVGAILLIAAIGLISLMRVIACLVILALLTFTIFAALAMVMNDENIDTPPGWRARTIRFFTVDYAATSGRGLGSAPCPISRDLAEAQTAEQSAGTPIYRRVRRRNSSAGPSHSATKLRGTGDEDNDYPELVTRGYPGIPPEKLFDIARETVNSLGGWKINNADQRAGILDCVYTTRLLGFKDDVKIYVTPRSNIEICAQSKTGEPDSRSLLRFFGGDFGANIGRIKQFYEALGPNSDVFYRAQDQAQQMRVNENRPIEKRTLISRRNIDRPAKYTK